MEMSDIDPLYITVPKEEVNTNDDLEIATFKTEDYYEEYLEEYEFLEVDVKPSILHSMPSPNEIIEENSTTSLIGEVEVDEYDNDFEENDILNYDEEVCPTQDKTDSNLFHCVTCNTNFPSISDHINEFHFGEEIIIQSDDDDDVIETPKEIPESSNSTNIIIQTYRFQCQICKKYLKSLRTLKTHERKQHNNKLVNNVQKKEANLKCSICSTTFMSEKSLKLHARMHNAILKQKTMDDIKAELGTSSPTSSSLAKTFLCEMCDKTYDLSLKNIHMQMHNDENANVCTVCNKHFSKAEHLKIHEITHTSMKIVSASQSKTEQKAKELNANDKKLKYRCQYCNYGFGRPHEKVKHERIHTGEKPYACEVCGKSFRVTYCLTLHMRTHTNERPFVCRVCNKRFKSNSVYSHHLLTHSDARPYQCPECPKAFKTAVQLGGHKYSHSKPFSCTDCGRTFATLYAARNHMESHNKLNHNLKHTCDLCGATYARGFALKNHINEQHPFAELPLEEKISNKKMEFSRQKILIDNTETEVAEQSILPVDGSVEIYSEIDQFATEEVITDWLR